MDTNQRHELWHAMGELFLDTDTRYQIPSLAARCLRLGLTPPQARDIFRCEVAPALWTNLLDVAGEWAYWDHEWLVERIEKLRRRPGWWATLLYWLTAWAIDPFWRAVERCMTVYEPLLPEEAAGLEAELSWLGRVFFDFVPRAMPTRRPPAAMRRLYQLVFLPIFEPLVVRDQITRESKAICRARVEAALSRSDHVLR